MKKTYTAVLLFLAISTFPKSNWKLSTAELRRLKQEEIFFATHRVSHATQEPKRFARDIAEERRKSKAKTLSRKRSQKSKTEHDNYSPQILPKIRQQHLVLRISTIKSDDNPRSIAG